MSSSFRAVGRILHNWTSLTTVLGRPFSYKSSISLDNLYPTSTLKLTTPTFTPLNPDENFSGYIPVEKLDITYSCSSGPGGQNVNKVHTKVDIRFKVSEADWLDPSIKEALFEKHKTRISKNGYFIVKSDVTRSQQMNLAHCLKNLRDMIRKAAEPAPQMSSETSEKIRKGKEKASRERLMMKRAESVKRNLRQAPTIHDL